VSEQTAERSPNGQFAQGHKGSGGRPPKARELAYLAIIAEEVTLSDFRQVVGQALKDATSGEDGRTRDYGRRWIADYLIGRPRQTLHINTGPGERDEFDEYSDEALEAIIAEEERLDRERADSDPERAAVIAAARADDADPAGSTDRSTSAREPGGAHTQTG